MELTALIQDEPSKTLECKAEHAACSAMANPRLEKIALKGTLSCFQNAV